jgi:hypothetical protein
MCSLSESRLEKYEDHEQQHHDEKPRRQHAAIGVSPRSLHLGRADR